MKNFKTTSRLGKKDLKFIRYQKKWNEDNVESDRFNWQTRNKIIIWKEKKLLEAISKHKGSILEVGCGEGANSLNINMKKKIYTGCDYSESRIRFAKRYAKGKFIVSDGTKLSFKNSTFDIVFCRDVIHHLRYRDRLISEMYRVCRKGGSVILIESNAMHPVNIAFSLLFKKERDMRKINPWYVRMLMSGIDGKPVFNYSEAYNVDRLFFHYKMGFPRLSENRAIYDINKIINNILDFITPDIFKAYMIVELKKTK